jgi:hypothetical protein
MLCTKIPKKNVTIFCETQNNQQRAPIYIIQQILTEYLIFLSVIKKIGHSAVPVRVDLPSQNLMGCTLLSGGRHVLLVNRSRVYGWDWNRYGQVGNGTLMDVFTPVEIQVNDPRSSLAIRVGAEKVSKKVGSNAVRVKSVVAGWRHSMICTQGGVVYVWGMAGLHSSSVSLMPPPKASDNKDEDKDKDKDKNHPLRVNHPLWALGLKRRVLRKKRNQQLLNLSSRVTPRNQAKNLLLF